MLIPLSALAASRLSEKARKQCMPGADRIRIERDSHNRPWLVATDGRLLLAFTWKEPEDSARVLSRCKLGDTTVPAAERAGTPAAGFYCEIPSVLAAMLHVGGKKGDLGMASSGEHSWLALVEDTSAPVLYAPQSGAVLTIMCESKPGRIDKFPQWRVLFTKATERLSRGKASAAGSEMACVQTSLLRPELTRDMADILNEAGLDCQRFYHVTLPSDKKLGEQPILFSAWNYDHVYNSLCCTGAIMPLTESAHGDPPLWVPSPVQEVREVKEGVQS